MDEMMMHHALLIATIGRTAELAYLLASLQKQTYTRFHIYIADQNPHGYLDATLQQYISSLPITVVRVPAHGVSSARNALLPLAQGDIIAFPDDDCWYALDTLERVTDFFATYTHAGAVVGQWSTLDTPLSLSHRPTPIALTRQSVFRTAGTLVQFYRHKVVQTVGTFDEILGPGTGLPYGCGEDTDYLLRAMDAGFSVWRDPRIRLFHPLPDLTQTKMTPKWRAYGQGRMYLLRKHGFAWWFKWANVAYPLYRAILEGPQAWRYRWAMFCGRLKGFWA